MKIASKADDFYKELCKEFRNEFVANLASDSWQEHVFELASEVGSFDFSSTKLKLLGNLLVDMEDIAKAAQSFKADEEPEIPVVKIGDVGKSFIPYIDPGSMKAVKPEPKSLSDNMVADALNEVKSIRPFGGGWYTTAEMKKRRGVKSDSALHSQYHRGQLLKEIYVDHKNRRTAYWKETSQSPTPVSNLLDQNEDLLKFSVKETKKTIKSPTDPSRLKPETKKNLQLVTRCLASFPLLSRGEISKKTGLKVNKVSYILNYAEGRNLVESNQKHQWGLTEYGLKAVKVLM